MFLNELKKNEAIAFINLVGQLADVDDLFSAKEDALTKDYISELSLSNEILNNLTFDEALKNLENSNIRIKSIIYFELIGLALVDGTFSVEEFEFLKKIAANFKITPKKQSEFMNYFKEVKNIYDNSFVAYTSNIETLNEKALKLLD